MNAAATLTLSASAALLVVASRREHVAGIEPGDGDVLGGFSVTAVVDRGEAIFNRITEELAAVDSDTAARNIGAFLDVIRRAEGTNVAGDPYRVCYGYRHTIDSFADHPAVTGEWRGERLSDAMCANAGFGPGCKSSAAGAYQLIRGTWLRMRDKLGLPDFSPPSQDAAAVELVRLRGALEDTKAGRFSTAIAKCRNEWASLPGNYARQGQRSITQLAGWFQNAGGTLA